MYIGVPVFKEAQYITTYVCVCVCVEVSVYECMAACPFVAVEVSILWFGSAKLEKEKERGGREREMQR